MGVVDGLLDGAGEVALDARELGGLVHCLVPGLLFDGGIDGFGGAGAGVGIEDLASTERDRSWSRKERRGLVSGAGVVGGVLGAGIGPIFSVGARVRTGR